MQTYVPVSYWSCGVGLLRQDFLEAILVIFGCRALIFFLFESSWKNMKMTPLLCACAVVITLETQKCRKKAPRSVEFNFFINCDRQKRFSQIDEGQIYKTLPQNFKFLPRDLVMIFQSFVMILPRFFDFERPPWQISPQAKIKKFEATCRSHEHDEQVCQVS